ncbi:BgTH12-07083 [Blumeria graminis f. sp. triticale]|uniref:BgTH12-07083 n=1 Tax=Blumeria graminis f. sp. triticale TaxID=1689686 RepID=A0A9W4GIR3_BLUGR|nr:BgTH12-07083 [Blumeria graminis f. sp. triticale]
MSAQLSAISTAQTVAQLLPKLHDVDPDHRFMSLNDLFQVLTISKQDLLTGDYVIAARAVDGIIKTLDDQNGEVQNLAIKCLVPLVSKIPSGILVPLLEKLSTLTTQNSVDRSIPAMALRTVVVTLARPIAGVTPSREAEDAYSAISRVLIPRLVGQDSGKLDSSSNTTIPGILDFEVNTDIGPESVDVLIEVVRCFGPLLKESEVMALQKLLVFILNSEKASPAVKKRVVMAASILAIYLTDDGLSGFIYQLKSSLQNPQLPLVQRKIYITILGSMARSIPTRLGIFLKTLAPYVLAVLNQDEQSEQLNGVDDEEPNQEKEDVREAAILTLEGFLSSCGGEMREYTGDVTAALLRFLKYDPNYINNEDEEMGDSQDSDSSDDEFDDADDEFEANIDFDDDDDSSWKIRRCAAKALYTFISTRGSGDLLDDGTLYSKIAPVLIQCFSEREENVRLEIIATMTSLIKKTGETVYMDYSLDNDLVPINNLPLSRKRRRESSTNIFDAKSLLFMSTGLTSPVFEPIPTSGPRADLARQTPAIMKASTKLLKGNSIPTKQSIIRILDEIVSAQNGGLSEYFGLLVDPIIESIKTTSGSTGSSIVTSGTATATINSLRIAALRLLGDITYTHSSSVLRPYLSKIVPGVISAVNDKSYKVSIEAITTVEQLIKALTPPRSNLDYPKNQFELKQLYDVIVSRISANDADLEVRQCAIQAFGILLARTANREGFNFLSSTDYNLAFNLLSERLKNETTRFAAVHAIDTIATLAAREDRLEPSWVREVSLELSAQFRKADRSLRGASLGALRNLIAMPSTALALDKLTVESLASTLMPLLSPGDLHLLSPALHVFATLVNCEPGLVAGDSLNFAICQLLKSNIGSTALEALLILVTSIGIKGAGQKLMLGLLKDVNTNGDPAIVGKVIGTLLAYGGPSVGVSIDSFLAESVNSDSTDPQKCLAVAVLGETGLLLGKNSNLCTSTFTVQFSAASEKVRLASAVALGRAGAGNIPDYLPEILRIMSGGGNTEYLLLHSIKEIIQQASNSGVDISAYIQPLWDQLISASQVEDNKAIGVECIGRLTILDPKTYITELQGYLSDSNASVRAMAIQAIRYTLADGDAAFDRVLIESLVKMLSTMLQDTETENRRLALTTLSSVAHNKPAMIISNLGELLPFVIQESIVKPELVREVPMGPFKHKIDDGLEVRKSAYETLYSLMETSFSRISILTFYDRILAGLRDQHDIRALCNLMLTKLVVLDPEETARRLDSIAEAFRSILSVKLKDTAVKQEIEKQEEAIKSVLRVGLLLHSSIPNASPALGSVQVNQGWRTYWEWLEKDFGTHLRKLKEEIKLVEN